MMNYNAAVLNGKCLQKREKGIRKCNLANIVEKRLDSTCVLFTQAFVSCVMYD